MINIQEAIEGIITNLKQNKNEEALLESNRALTAFPVHGVLMSLKATALQELGNYDEAFYFYRRSIELDFKNPSTWHNLGNAYKKINHVLASLACYSMAYELSNNTNGSALKNLIWATAELKQCDKVLELAKSFEISYGQDLDVMGYEAFASIYKGDWARAKVLYEHIAANSAPRIMLFVNMLSTYFNLMEWDNTAKMIQKVLEIDPKHEIAQAARCKLALKQGKYLEALDLYKDFINRFPENHDAIFDLGLLYLHLYRYKEGLEIYERRWDSPLFKAHKRFFESKEYAGEDLTDKTLLIWDEQGYGDTLQFLRFIPNIQKELKPKQIIIQCDRALYDLLKASIRGVTVITKQEIVPPHDYSMASCSTLYWLTKDMSNKQILRYIKATNTPYLTPSMPSNVIMPDGYNIGIAWSGNPAQSDNHIRSVDSIKHFKLIKDIKIKGKPVNLHCLQINNRTKDIYDAGFDIINQTPQLDTFDKSAAYIKKLDLVITVDTATAHLCGGLGVSTIVILAKNCDWRYEVDKDKSMWYPSFTLFRQSNEKDWHELLGRLAKCLEFS